MAEARSKRRRTHQDGDRHQENEGAYVAKSSGWGPSRSRGPAKAVARARAKESAQIFEPAFYRAADCTR